MIIFNMSGNISSCQKPAIRQYMAKRPKTTVILSRHLSQTLPSTKKNQYIIFHFFANVNAYKEYVQML